MPRGDEVELSGASRAIAAILTLPPSGHRGFDCGETSAGQIWATFQAFASLAWSSSSTAGSFACDSLSFSIWENADENWGWGQEGRLLSLEGIQLLPDKCCHSHSAQWLEHLDLYALPQCEVCISEPCTKILLLLRVQCTCALTEASFSVMEEPEINLDFRQKERLGVQPLLLN